MMKEGLTWFIITLFVGYCYANNTTDLPECMSNDDCATDRVCAKQKCTDPCDGVCGLHTVCHVTHHVAMCSCSPGHSGHPVLGCSPSTNVPGHSGCSGHDQCPLTKACIEGKCDDPCEDLCGDNTSCTVRYHVPACACKEGHTGNPFLGCTPQAAPGSWPPPGKKKFYAVTSHEVDWQEAFMYCVKNNSRLASIDSVEEYEEIKQAITLTGATGAFWTSGSDSGSEGHFTWASSGKDVSLPKHLWFDGEPNNAGGNENCLVLVFNAHKLNDGGCQYNCKFVCEYYA